MVNCITKVSIFAHFLSGAAVPIRRAADWLVPDAPAYPSAAATSPLSAIVARNGSATVSAASWASWFTDAQQSPTTTTL